MASGLVRFRLAATFFSHERKEGKSTPGDGRGGLQAPRARFGP